MRHAPAGGSAKGMPGPEAFTWDVEFLVDILPNGSEPILHADVVDGNELCYRYLAEGYAVGKNGEPDDQRISQLHMFRFAGPIWIFDKSGNVLYTIEEELFW